MQIYLPLLIFEFASEFQRLYEPLRVNVWVTSEENSYGLATEKWFDGAIEHPAISFANSDGNLIDENIPGAYPYSYKTCIKIAGVTEYHNMMSHCLIYIYTQFSL